MHPWLSLSLSPSLSLSLSLSLPLTLTLSCTRTDEFLLTNIVAGMLSGAISSAIANPTDVLKVSQSPSTDQSIPWILKDPIIFPLFFIQVRMQSGTSGTVIVRQSCLKSFRQIYSEEGLRGLYRVSVVLTLHLSICLLKLICNSLWNPWYIIGMYEFTVKCFCCPWSNGL